MNFISITFAVFFIAVVLLLRFAPSRNPRQALLLIASLGFYAAYKPIYLLILLAPICIDFFCAIQIEQRAGATARKWWLAAGVISNLALLGYFKYADFFRSNVASLFHIAPRHLEIVLPLGISFFTLKSLSYLIDVYRGDLRACRSVWCYALYVSYFPDLIAGPIVRASTFLPQLDRSLRPSLQDAVAGCHMILLGLTKKLLVADQMAIFVDPVFAAPAAYSPLTVWSAVVAYSLQIYCDFSGYSDMAIGASKMIGIDLPENFNMPYLATSPIDFWRRWHITLSRWLRDYIYFALPAKRSKPWQRYRNVMITFLLCGLWHGASWTFVCWGALHGLGLAANHWWTSRNEIGERARGGFIVARCGRWLAMYVFICITWVLFRAPSFPLALAVLRKMTGVATGGVAWLYSPLLLVLPIVIAAHAIGFLASRHSRLKEDPEGVLAPAPVLVSSNPLSGVYVILRPSFLGAFLITSWVLAVLLFGATGASPFVYFKF